MHLKSRGAIILALAGNLNMTEYPKRPDRFPTRQLCTIARDDGAIVAGTLLNLSNAGFCVSAKCRLVEGERIEVRILGLGRLKGIIRWAQRCRAGGILDTGYYIGG